MADAALVVLVVLGAGSREPMHGSVVAAATREGAGTDVRVLLDERAAAPTDADLVELADTTHATAIAEVRWSDDDATRARLHLYVASDRRWYDRELSFAKADALPERERAVGLVLGAIVREASIQSAAGEERPAAPPPAPPSTAPAISVPPSTSVPAAPPDRTAPVPRGRAPRFVVEGSALGTSSADASGADLGPSLRARWAIVDELELRASAAMRFGTIPSADATTRATRIGGGVAWRAVTFGPDRTLSVAFALEVVAVQHAVERVDPEARRSRWITGTFAATRFGWRASRTFEPFIAGGVEAVLGATPIVVGGRTVAEIGPLRIAAEAGIALHF